MTIEENVILSSYTTFKIGGTARYFLCVKNIDDLKRAADFVREKNVPVFILGGGSNILVSDQGFDGLVLKMEILGKTYDESGKETILVAGAGEDWDSLVAETVKKGLHGLENLSYIPGSVGAAPVQNIGAYGSEVKDSILWVEAFDLKTGEIRKYTNAECQFSYRDSYFKHSGKGLVITRVAFKLIKVGAVSIEYKDLKNYFADKKAEPNICSVRDAVIEIRTRKLPDVKKIGTAGSFFKNPIITKSEYENLLQKYPELPKFPVDDSRVKIPAAWILDNICGFKGVRRGNVGVYQNQALVLVNFCGATAAEVQKLAQDMIECVRDKTSIVLAPEVEMVGKMC